jgi:hypothetical protein|tara:strand:- start:772 stop:1308 length:537 start_codon:yes stop_codon:yes gene_type:complete
MASSTANDRHIVNQFKRTRSVDVGQLQNVIPLNEYQIQNLCGNYLRMAMHVQDNNDALRYNKAMHYEQIIAGWLQGSDYYTQDQLQENNRTRQKKGQTALPTPDFLLKQPIDIEGVPVHWIECKNYYASTEQKIAKKQAFIKSAVKYQQHYGPGIMVFGFGFNKDIPIPQGVRFKHIF